VYAPKIEDDERVQHRLRLRYSHPTLELAHPSTQWLNPLGIVSGKAARTGWEAERDQSLYCPLAETLEIPAHQLFFPCRWIRVEDAVILIGADCLLATPLATVNQPTVRDGRWPKLDR
jgi:hypothetical protein